MWRRIHVVPFTETIPVDKVDKALPAALATEVPGILNWAIAGLRDWQVVDLEHVPSARLGHDDSTVRVSHAPTLATRPARPTTVAAW